MKLIKNLGLKKRKYTDKQRHNFSIYECPSCFNHIELITGTDKKACKKCSDKMPKKHGLTKTNQYNIWATLIQRTHNPNNKNYNEYKHRKPPEKWNTFEGFWDDMGVGYKDGLQIDRKNNNLPYGKKNCRWVSKNIQAQNTKLIRRNNTSGYRGVSKSGKKWQVDISANKIKYYLGMFDYPWTAAYIYDSFILANNLNHPMNFKEAS